MPRIGQRCATIGCSPACAVARRPTIPLLTAAAGRSACCCCGSFDRVQPMRCRLCAPHRRKARRRSSGLSGSRQMPAPALANAWQRAAGALCSRGNASCRASTTHTWIRLPGSTWAMTGMPTSTCTAAERRRTAAAAAPLLVNCSWTAAVPRSGRRRAKEVWHWTTTFCARHIASRAPGPFDGHHINPPEACVPGGGTHSFARRQGASSDLDRPQAIQAQGAPGPITCSPRA